MPSRYSGFTRESLAVAERQTGKKFRFILPAPEISKRDQERCLDRLGMLAPSILALAGFGRVVAPPPCPAMGLPEQPFHELAVGIPALLFLQRIYTH